MSNDTRQEATYSDSACKWTPGPWQIEDDGDNPQDHYWVESETGRAVARIHPTSGRTMADNAALIALAPSMAEAILAWWDEANDDTPDTPANGLLSDVVQKLRAIGGDQ